MFGLAIARMLYISLNYNFILIYYDPISFL